MTARAAVSGAGAPATVAVRPDTSARRAADVVVASFLLVVLTPVIVLLGLAVVLDSRGPVLFRQQRVGRGGGTFRIRKFRTMRPDAERIGPLVSGRRDTRVTRVGRFLRGTHLDELPQLWNVLRGDMTLIGPRPEVPRYLPHYTPSELRVLQVRPGLAGPGQLGFAAEQSAELDETSDPERHYVEVQLHDKLAVDLEYLHSRSLRLDLDVLRRTARYLLFNRSERTPCHPPDPNAPPDSGT